VSPPLCSSVFFIHWCKRVVADDCRARSRSSPPQSEDCLCQLLEADVAGFTKTDRREAVRSAFRAFLDELTAVWTDMADVDMGRLHTLVQKHFLSSVANWDNSLT